MNKSAPSFYSLAKRSYWIWIGGFLFFVSLVATVLGLEERRYEAEGQKVDGKVLDKEVRMKTRTTKSATGDSRYYVIYRFTTREGQTIEGRNEVVRRMWDKLKEGDSVEVEYLRSAPHTNRIPGGTATASSSSYRKISGLLFLAGAVVLIIGSRKVYVKLRLLRQAPDAGEASG